MSHRVPAPRAPRGHAQPPRHLLHRPSRLLDTVAHLGSATTLAALVVLGTAVAAALAGSGVAESGTHVVTFEISGHR